MATGDIKLNPAEAAGVFGGTSAKLDGLVGEAPAAGGGSGVDPAFSTSADSASSNIDQNVRKGSDQSRTGADAANGMGDTDKNSGSKIGSGPDAQDSTRGGGGRGPAGGDTLRNLDAPRLTAADLAKASPYQSSMPMNQTANILPSLAQAAQQGAESLPSALSSPLSGVSGMTAPFQSMLSGPGGGQMLDSMLAKANASNGFDGGPASLVMSSGGSARLNDIAKNVLGIPYAWGGGSMSGPSQGISDGGGPADRAGDFHKIGFDCSGLSRYVTGQLKGVEIPRSSEAQYAAGMAVSQPMPGDLAFPASAGRPPGHVQIYLGNGQVLEAPSSGQTVKISPLSPGSEFRRFGATTV
ncbi:MAG: C40 family peptidase [Mycobacterium sp.]|nr:C40 family peptidase [Mycobacterium sp.]